MVTLSSDFYGRRVMGWKDIFGPYGAGSSLGSDPNAAGYTGGGVTGPGSIVSGNGFASTATNIATAAQTSSMSYSQLAQIMQAQMQMQAAGARNPSYGHSDEQLKTLKGSTEYFYIEKRDSMMTRQIMPLYDIKSFRLGHGCTRQTDIHSVAQVQVPAEMYTSRAEAEAGVAEKLREFLTSMVDQLSAEMTQASLGSGLLSDPELDLTDALRKYLAAVKT